MGVEVDVEIVIDDWFFWDFDWDFNVEWYVRFCVWILVIVVFLVLWEVWFCWELGFGLGLWWVDE